MGRPRKVRLDWAALAPIWEVSDELWGVLAPLIAAVDPPQPTGRRRVDARAILNAILFRLRSGCQWNQLPERFPDDSTVHSPSSVGSAWGSSSGCGPCCWSAVTSWAGWTGSGRRPTA